MKVYYNRKNLGSAISWAFLVGEGHFSVNLKHIPLLIYSPTKLSITTTANLLEGKN